MKIRTRFVVRAESNRRADVKSVQRFPLKASSGEVVLREKSDTRSKASWVTNA